MKTIEEIRAELRQVSYYFLRQEFFDAASKKIGASNVLNVVQQYSVVVRSAPAQLYLVYDGLYVRNLSQRAFSMELNYSEDYVHNQNKRLLLFLQQNL